MQRKFCMIPAVISLLLLGSPVLAGDMDRHNPFFFSHIFSQTQDARVWEQNLEAEINRDTKMGLISPLQGQQLMGEMQQILQQHQAFLNQFSASSLKDEQRSQIQNDLANLNAQRQNCIQKNFNGKYSFNPFHNANPMAWKDNLSSRIQKDAADKLLTQQQAQARLNQIEQIRAEHKNFFGSNGKTLTEDERKHLQHQLDAINREREDDVHHNQSQTPNFKHFK